MRVKYVFEASRHIDAPAERVYGIIADYHAGHPGILPKAFRNLVVEQGGVGAGTIIRFEVHALGTVTKFRGHVTEPEPGRVLVESYTEPGPSTTTFIVAPGSGGDCDVTFHSELESRGGIAGIIERFFSRRFLKKLYAEELQLLAARASGM